MPFPQPQSQKTRFFSPRIACATAGFLLALLVEWSGFGERIDLQVSDLLFQHLGTRFKPSPEIVLLVIDDASLQLMEPKVGRWPWPRSCLARLIQACSGAASVGLDILLLESDRLHPDDDAMLAKVLRQHGRNALAGSFVDGLVRETPMPLSGVLKRSLFSAAERPGAVQAERLLQQFLTPLPMIGESAGFVGHANFFPSKDHILRSYPYFIATDQGLMPSLVIATLMANPNDKSIQNFKSNRGGGGKAMQSHELIFYSQPFAHYSASDVLGLTGRPFDPRWVAGKMVLIGVEAQGLHDLRATPVAGNRSGLDIHGTALSNWLQQTWLLELNSFGILLLAGLFGAMPLLGWNEPMGKTWTRWGLFVVGYHALGAVTFFLIPLRLPWVGPMCAFTTTTVCRLTIFLQRERALRRGVEELQSLKRMLTNMLLHDLNAPLNGIMMLIQTVLPDLQVGSKAHRRMGNAMDETSRLSEMLRTLLDIQRMESGRMELATTSFKWMELVDQTVSRLQQRAHQSRLRVETIHEGGADEVQGDPTMLGRVLMNILDNALKYASLNSSILCKTVINHPRAGWLTFCVINCGPVIEPADQEIIFETFRQSPQSGAGRVKAGFGLGLAFCRLAIFAHGGRLRCISPAPGSKAGACFEFSIPLTPQPQNVHSPP